MRELDRQRGQRPYQYQNQAQSQNQSQNQKRGKDKSQSNETEGMSLGFCWGFGVVVCMTFGLASFLMFSAGHFNFSPGSGVNAAWGSSQGDETVRSRSLINVEVTALENADRIQAHNEELYANAHNLNNLEENSGPSYRYMSIILSAHEDGTNMPEPDEEDSITDEEIKAANKEHEQDDNNNKPDKSEEVMLAEVGPQWREHIVKNGETLSDIAMAHGNITAQDILRANGLKDANRLSENQLLLIPNDPGAVEDTMDEVKTRQMRIEAKQEKVTPISTKKYTVNQGDSLWVIASSQGIEVDTITGSNTFTSSARLRPGMVLRIPNQDGIFYVMKKGDDIKSVCKRYGVSLTKVKGVNAGVDVASLKTGEEVFLPGARPDGVIEHDDVKLAEVPAQGKKNPGKINNKGSKKNPVKSDKNDKNDKVSKNDKSEKLPKGEVAVKNSGGFRWPIMGRINSPFGWRQHPLTKRRDFHTGIDIKASRGDPIKGAGAGRVVYSGWMGGYGKVIVLEHRNGQSTLYAHCSTLLVGKGANVTSGQLIAKVGTTGRSTGPHLHFEVRNGNSPVNPIKYLSR
ncbi:MAG: peptidoglycan DD-metalloendopeptidase family protein [Synergistaceae bacterium]|nr:peptidoglycan DD-metalloendopeptidase family protein [Synergistaceae bacterium]